jgi:hypothetical protein
MLPGGRDWTSGSECSVQQRRRRWRRGSGGSGRGLESLLTLGFQILWPESWLASKFLIRLKTMCMRDAAWAMTNDQETAGAAPGVDSTNRTNEKRGSWLG